MYILAVRNVNGPRCHARAIPEVEWNLVMKKVPSMERLYDVFEECWESQHSMLSGTRGNLQYYRR